ncbi:hypothetical protein SNOUR_16540 [Streptomyces noursei ATCC 11455]|nr:hypothetical protein SNOUR_16540 [Streptomyces noursei ATCC 11455]
MRGQREAPWGACWRTHGGYQQLWYLTEVKGLFGDDLSRYSKRCPSKLPQLSRCPHSINA